MGIGFSGEPTEADTTRIQWFARRLHAVSRREDLSGNK